MKSRKLSKYGHSGQKFTISPSQMEAVMFGIAQICDQAELLADNSPITELLCEELHYRSAALLATVHLILNGYDVTVVDRVSDE